MSVYSGYDTDDLTDRQNHYFNILNKHVKGKGITMFALSFLKHCVQQNHSYGQFDNYEGDCDYLIRHRENSEKLGIVIEDIYK